MHGSELIRLDHDHDHEAYVYTIVHVCRRLPGSQTRTCTLLELSRSRDLFLDRALILVGAPWPRGVYTSLHYPVCLSRPRPRARPLSYRGVRRRAPHTDLQLRVHCSCTAMDPQAACRCHHDHPDPGAPSTSFGPEFWEDPDIRRAFPPRGSSAQLQTLYPGPPVPGAPRRHASRAPPRRLPLRPPTSRALVC